MNSPRISVAAPLGVLLLLATTSVFAAPPQTPPLPPSSVSLGGVLQVLLGLAIVLGAVAATAWLLKRFAPGQVSAGGGIRLIGGIAVGPKERVVVVEVGETWLVVGVAPGQVTALHNMPRIASLPGNNALAGGDQRFSAWLKDVMSRRNAASGGK
ncbi:MAG: flagellar biosynthetic protein FliO [Nitrosomonadales bacterium]|nr:MAG: flagellar biosynthetic protein FliO [Nitrosomonadales bacterium]